MKRVHKKILGSIRKEHIYKLKYSNDKFLLEVSGEAHNNQLEI